jgi:hypothetical protein
MDPSFIQVGSNAHEGVVKLRAPDEKSPDGHIVQRLSPRAARVLAEWLEDGAPKKTLRVTDGHRWTEHVLPSAAILKMAADLRRCADAIDSVGKTP